MRVPLQKGGNFERRRRRRRRMGYTFCIFSLVVVWFVCMDTTSTVKYEPNWASLDSRPLPSWYDEAKFGIFMHWGVFSVPSFKNEWFWFKWKHDKNPDYVKFMQDNYAPNFEYPDFAPQFKAEFYDPDKWADILKASGAKYLVLTSKHHEGWTNWGSKYSWNWNAADVGPNRDLLGDLAASVRARTDLYFGLYYSLYEWFHPLYLQDKQNNFTSQKYIEMVMMPQLSEIINQYKPDVIWADGDWEAPDTYWNSTDFLAWLYNTSPVKDSVVTNDRWGSGDSCKHGGYYTCSDRYNPGVLQKHKWENCMTIDKKSWGYRRDAYLTDYLTMDDLTKTLIETVSCGGNLLMNIGPTHDGRIMPIFEERLRQMGDWLKVNGEAIYSSKPWTSQNDTVTKGVWYTSKSDAVYATILDWPASNDLILASPKSTPQTTVHMLGYSPSLTWKVNPTKGITVTMPTLNVDEMPCQWAWVLKFTNVN